MRSEGSQISSSARKGYPSSLQGGVLDKHLRILPRHTDNNDMGMCAKLCIGAGVGTRRDEGARAKRHQRDRKRTLNVCLVACAVCRAGGVSFMLQATLWSGSAG